LIFAASFRRLRQLIDIDARRRRFRHALTLHAAPLFCRAVSF
jgi:hypothetical protein